METHVLGHHNGSKNGHAVEANGAREAVAPIGAERARLAGLIEGLLFAAAAPVSLTRLVDALAGPNRSEVLGALATLRTDLERAGRGLRLAEVAGGYQLRTLPEHGPLIRRLLGGRPPRLSRPMLETLAIVAYRQPCTRVEIEAIRGVDVEAVLSTLLERRLVRILGRKEAVGRPLLYGTTREFLEVFGLPDLSALPPLRGLPDGAHLLVDPDLRISPEGVRPTTGGADQAAEPATSTPVEDGS